MRTHARAVVIGGGVVGVSTLYHLVKKGWTDCVLVERRELTSGSTWHAAGLLPLFNLSYSVGQIHKYSVALYRTLEAETGLDVGLRQVSNIRLARTRDRMDEYRYYTGVAATIGIIAVLVHAVARAREADVRDLAQADVEARLSFERLVERDGVFVDLADGIAEVEQRQKARRMPGRA